MLKVCFTGGPGGGKSSAQSALTQILQDRGYKVLFCPETATKLIINGIVPGEQISLEEFQKFVLDKQLAKEQLYDELANYYDTNKLIIIYDRGICDQMAYISKEKFEDMLHERNMSLADAYDHYDCVFHLVTAADGANDYYVWNDPSKNDCGNNAARSESPEEAIIKDKQTKEAWIGHPHLRIFDNTTDFDGKIKKVINELCSILGEPTPTEIERKFLIKKPSAEEIAKLGCISNSNIIQTYLTRKTPNVERRIRQRSSVKNGFNFYYTEKTDIAYGERHEVEKKITPSEYINYLTEADTSLHQISKKRYCFLHDNKYFKMDIYPFDDEYAILEIELNDINEDISLPNLNIIKEVTNNPSFKNATLAKSLSLRTDDILTNDNINETKWIYETGREESEILGSGSNHYNVTRTHDEHKAFELAMNTSNNYLIRYKIENHKTIARQWYDFQCKHWIDD